MTLLLLSLAGGAGAVARFVVDSLVARHNPFRVPLGTLLVNVTGSLALGLVTGWVAYGRDAGEVGSVSAILGTGLCGGYTTFSTASVETVRLWLAEGPRQGVGYAALSLLGGVSAAAVGLALGALL